MEPFWIVLRDDFTSGASRYETEDKAREIARKLCEKYGKTFIVAQVMARYEVEKYPVRVVNANDEDAA